MWWKWNIIERILINNLNLDFNYDSICVLCNHGEGKTTLLKSLKKINNKFKYYFLEKSNYDHLDNNLPNNPKCYPYLKALTKKGEIVRICYPNIDFRQFIDFLHMGVKINDSNIIYLHDDSNNIYRQEYIENTSIWQCQKSHTK